MYQIEEQNLILAMPKKQTDEVVKSYGASWRSSIPLFLENVF